MDSLILDLQIVFYVQLFLSANVRHTSSAKNNNCSVLLEVKNLYSCSECHLCYAISIPKDK